jgi:hypothetical protein
MQLNLRVLPSERELWARAAGGQSLSGWIRDALNRAAAGDHDDQVVTADPVGSPESVAGAVGLRDATGSWRCPFHPRGGPFTGPDVDCAVCAGLPVLVPGGTFEQVTGQAGALQLALQERGLSDLECGELLYRAVTGHGYDEQAPEAAAGR